VKALIGDELLSLYYTRPSGAYTQRIIRPPAEEWAQTIRRVAQKLARAVFCCPSLCSVAIDFRGQPVVRGCVGGATAE
jgi:hypothetical protein